MNTESLPSAQTKLLQGATTQKITIYIHSAVKTSTPTAVLVIKHLKQTNTAYLLDEAAM
jgi:hypothetical protein